jgi:hypothetical protein
MSLRVADNAVPGAALCSPNRRCPTTGAAPRIDCRSACDGTAAKHNHLDPGGAVRSSLFGGPGTSILQDWRRSGRLLRPQARAHERSAGEAGDILMKFIPSPSSRTLSPDGSEVDGYSDVIADVPLQPAAGRPLHNGCEYARRRLWRVRTPGKEIDR